jgi:hypothetical protein
MTLNRFESEGLITAGRQRLVVHNLPMLENISI